VSQLSREEIFREIGQIVQNFGIYDWNLWRQRREDDPDRYDEIIE